MGGGSVDTGSGVIICPEVIGGECIAKEKANIPTVAAKLVVPPRNDADKQKMIDYLTNSFATVSAKALTNCKNKIDSCVKNGPTTDGETQKVICELKKPCKYTSGIAGSPATPCKIVKCTAVGSIHNNLRDAADFTFKPGASGNSLTLDATTGAVTAITFTGNFPDYSSNSPTSLQGGITCFAEGDATVSAGTCSALTSSADTQGGAGAGGEGGAS